VPYPLELDARGRRLRAALAAVLVRDNAPELRLAREWLDNWSGIGLIIAGITHQGWDVSAHGVRRSRLARDLLPGRDRTLHHRRHDVGADGVARPCRAPGWLLVRGPIGRPRLRRPGRRGRSCRVPRKDQRQTSVGMLECVSTLVVSLPRTSADMPLRPCEAMKIRSHPWAFAVSMIA
jgi:hypothetical protein